MAGIYQARHHGGVGADVPAAGWGQVHAEDGQEKTEGTLGTLVLKAPLMRERPRRILRIDV